MSAELLNKRVAIIATDGFEQAELTGPKEILEDAGAHVTVIAPKGGKIQGMKHADKGDLVDVDLLLGKAKVDDFDALMIPGGLLNPDALRATPQAIQLVRSFAEAGKPIAAICHGIWLLIEADLVRGRTLTSWPAIQTDVRNAGGDWVDKEVVVDRGIVTSRKPDDVPAFARKFIEEIREGIHQGMVGASAGNQTSWSPS